MVLNMSVHLGAFGRPRRAERQLLDVVAEVLVAQPGASLAEVARAAGISRTTLHKHYATRDELVRAVGLRAIEIWEQAMASVSGEPGTEAGLRELFAAMIESGPQLNFLWRNPTLDGDAELTRRYIDVEKQCMSVVHRARDLGVFSAATPDWWLLQTMNALVYTAAESVAAGHLAPREAPDLALNTLLHGLSAPVSAGAPPRRGRED
jgi:AcrR family transcriptional regulator